MTAPMRISSKLLLRAVFIAVVTVGGLSAGLGVTTYTMAMANDYVSRALGGDAGATSEVSCLME